MNLSTFYSKFFQKIYITQEMIGKNVINRVLNILCTLPVKQIREKEEIPAEDQNQHTLFITSPRGAVVTRCPGSKGHLCCNYFTVDLYLGCIIGCTYCIMQSYLNYLPLTVYADPEPALKKIILLAEQNPKKTLRIGTGEVGDSLFLDPLFDLSRNFIETLANYPNVKLELKTKTHFVDHLLEIKNKGNTVIAFSLNPQQVIDSEEGIASSLVQRIDAAKRAVEHGYQTAFHFDPIFQYPGWEQSYAEVVDLLRLLPAKRIAWISMGTFRYPPKLKDRLTQRNFLFDEFVPTRDGKYRYIQKIRTTIYKTIAKKIETLGKIPLYMCMESPCVWKNVMGNLPSKIKNLRDIF